MPEPSDSEIVEKTAFGAARLVFDRRLLTSNTELARFIEDISKTFSNLEVTSLTGARPTLLMYADEGKVNGPPQESLAVDQWSAETIADYLKEHLR